MNMNSEKIPAGPSGEAVHCAQRLRECYPVPDDLEEAAVFYMLVRMALEDEEENAEPKEVFTLLEYMLMSTGDWRVLAELWEKEEMLPESEKTAMHQRIREAAEHGNEHCLFFLGYLCEQEHLAECWDYYNKAAEYGQDEALFRLGKRHYSDDRPEEAVRYFRQAADRNHPEASLYFAYCSEEGIGVPKEPELSLKYYPQASLEFPYADYRLGAAAENSGDFRRAAEHYLDYLDYITPEDEWCTDFETGEVWLGLGRCLRTLPAKERPYRAPSPLDCFGNVCDLHSSREAEREAWFQIGSMHLFGIETPADPEMGCSLLADAAEKGSEKAAELLKKVQFWKQAPGETSADADARKREALLRLEILEGKGMDPSVRAAFAENTVPGFAADDCYGFASFEAENYPEIQRAAENLERRGFTVYFIHVSLTLSYGSLVSLFYVSDSTAEWPAERWDLLNGTPVAAVANLTEDYMEIGSISYIIDDNLMERLY